MDKYKLFKLYREALKNNDRSLQNELARSTGERALTEEDRRLLFPKLLEKFKK